MIILAFDYKKMRMLRRQAMMTQAQCGGVSTSQSDISQIEIGKKIPTNEQVIRFASKLNVSPAELYQVTVVPESGHIHDRNTIPLRQYLQQLGIEVCNPSTMGGRDG